MLYLHTGPDPSQPDPAFIRHHSRRLCPHLGCVSKSFQGAGSARDSTSMACGIRWPRNHVLVCSGRSLSPVLPERHAPGVAL